MKKLTICFILLFLPLHAQEEMTAEEAIKLGLKNNYNIQIARNNAQISQNNTGLGTAGFLPTLDVNGNYQYSTSEQETNSPFSFGGSDTKNGFAQAALNWTLFDGFQMFVAKNQFDELAELGEYQARSIIENLVVDILAAYFNLVQQEQLLDVAINARDVSKSRLDKEQVRSDLGAASSTDFLNAKVSYNNDVSTVLNQELRVLVARRELNFLLAQEPLTPITVKKEIIVPDLEMAYDDLFALAKEQNSDLRIARKLRKIAEQDIKLAKSPFYPRVSLGANYSFSDRTVSSNSDNFPEDIRTESKDGLIGLNLNWNLFNGFRNKIDLQNAKIEAKNSELELKNTENLLAGLVSERYETYQKRIELMQLEQQNVGAAQQNLNLQQDRYQIGATTSLEFRDAQVNLIRAQASLINARFQARISHLEIEQLIGRLAIE